MSGPAQLLIAGYIGIASVATFVVYALDKSAAKLGRRRVRERTLHGLALLGGWPGALVAQRLLRHKSSKGRFLFIYWLTVVLNLVGSFLLFRAVGMR